MMCRKVGVTLAMVAGSVVCGISVLAPDAAPGGLAFGATAETPKPGTLAEKVIVLRKVDPSALNEEQREAKAAELEAAWQELVKAGPQGAAALKTELKKIDETKEKDDRFKLSAAAILWQIGGVEEAGTIASLWSGDIDCTTNYNYVFYTAFEAALSQDTRVLPMLVAILRDQKGRTFVPQHSMTVAYSLSHDFIWGAFGPKGLPALARVLDESKEDTARASAVRLLAAAQDLKALDKIRDLARRGTGAAHLEAIKALGVFGHPKDYELLASFLSSADAEEVLAGTSALCDYGDLRAVPLLAPLLSHSSLKVRGAAFSALTYLLTPEALAALRAYVPGITGEQDKEMAQGFLQGLSNGLGTDLAAYDKKPEAEKAQALKALRERVQSRFVLKPGDRKLSHDDLLRAAAEWKTNHRITGGSYEWVEDRHVMAAATANDIPLLLEVTAVCYSRLSDECLDEVQKLQELISRLGRSRYRADVGVCEEVKPVPEAGK